MATGSASVDHLKSRYQSIIAKSADDEHSCETVLIAPMIFDLNRKLTEMDAAFNRMYPSIEKQMEEILADLNGDDFGKVLSSSKALLEIFSLPNFSIYEPILSSQADRIVRLLAKQFINSYQIYSKLESLTISTADSRDFFAQLVSIFDHLIPSSYNLASEITTEAYYQLFLSILPYLITKNHSAFNTINQIYFSVVDGAYVTKQSSQGALPFNKVICAILRIYRHLLELSQEKAVSANVPKYIKETHELFRNLTTELLLSCSVTTAVAFDAILYEVYKLFDFYSSLGSSHPAGTTDMEPLWNVEGFLTEAFCISRSSNSPDVYVSGDLFALVDRELKELKADANKVPFYEWLANIGVKRLVEEKVPAETKLSTLSPADIVSVQVMEPEPRIKWPKRSGIVNTDSNVPSEFILGKDLEYRSKLEALLSMESPEVIEEQLPTVTKVSDAPVIKTPDAQSANMDELVEQVQLMQTQMLKSYESIKQLMVKIKQGA